MTEQTKSSLPKQQETSLTTAYSKLTQKLAAVEFDYPEGGEKGAAIAAGKAYKTFFEDVRSALLPEIERLVISGRQDELKKIERLLDTPKMPNSGTVEVNMRAWVKDRLALTQEPPKVSENKKEK
jgi:hypothetical protein